MLATLEAVLKKAVITQLMLLGSLLLLTGCATMGANLALDLAKEEEAKGCVASDPGDIKKVELEDCERISRLIKKAGVPGGFVGYDKSGRIKLKGSYLNEEEVDMAFMVALTVVGASSLDISKVTPRDLQEIKMVKSYTPSQLSEKNGNKYALLVGVSIFEQDKDNKHGIATAVKDVNALKEVLYSNGFKKENITLLTDKQAKKANILSAVRELEGKVTDNDSVVVYISTHGTPPNTFGKMGIIPYDLKSDFKTEDVQAIANKISKGESGDNEIINIAKQRIKALKTAISFDDLQDFITSIKTDKFVAILDTCYSGAALGALTYPVGGVQYADRDQNHSQSLNAENKSELLGSGQACKQTDYPGGIAETLQTASDNNNSGTKALVIENADFEQHKTPGPRRNIGNDYMFDTLEKLKAAFSTANNAPRRGKILITATNGNEKSLFDDPNGFDLSRDMLPNSFFTFYLTKGLEKSQGQIFKAFDYAKVDNKAGCSRLRRETNPRNGQYPGGLHQYRPVKITSF